jgi:hypothetical protein
MKLGYRYLREKIFGATMERAGIDKLSNPHHYRHSRASYLATEMTEAQLCEWFGWVQESDVSAKYVHLSGRDIDNAYDQITGCTNRTKISKSRISLSVLNVKNSTNPARRSVCDVDRRSKLTQQKRLKQPRK